MSVKRYGMTLLGFAILVVLTFALAACGAAEEETTTAETTAAETTETESMDDESMASEDEMDDMDDESMASEDDMMDESDDSMAESDLTEAMETDLGIQTYSAEIDASKQRVHFTDPAVTPPDRDSIIRVRSWDYTCFDSHTLGCSGSLSSMLFNTLTQWYENPAEPLVVGDPRPLSELAESWSFPSSDTIQFTLRKGVKFHDVEPVNGREMVADDVVYSFQRGMLPDAPRAAELGDIASVTAVDDYTVEFKFNEPFAPFMTLVSQVRWRVDPPEAEEEFGDLRDAQSQIGTGPWMSATYEPNIKISMVRNDDYWRGPNGQTGEVLPLAKKLYAIIIEDEAAAMAAYRSGLQDHGPAWRCWGWWSALDDHLVALSDRPDLVYHYHSTGGGMYANYFYGPKLEGIWKNRNMRYAVAMFNDISCAAWCAVTGGIQDTRYVAVDNPWFLPNEELTPDGQQFYLNFPEPTMDLEKAQGFLMTAKEELGLPLDEPVKITLTIRGSDQSIIDIGGRYIADLNKIGFNSELVVLDSADRLKLVKGDFEHLGLMYNSGWQDADSLFYNRYHSASVNNYMGVDDPVWDDLIMQGRAEFDPAKRIEIYYELQKLQAEEQYDFAVPNWTNTNMFPEWTHNPGPQISANGYVGTYQHMWIDMDHPSRQGYSWE
jgi:peptide/nickel transport system substrate-binding protein